MRILLVCFSLLLIVMLVWLFQPAEDILEVEYAVTEETSQIDTKTETEDSTEQEEDNLRYEAMTAEYEMVEKSRRNLKRRLSRLKMVLWDQKLPKQEAEEIQLELMNAYALLKNPKLLGSFRDLNSLRLENEKLQYALEMVQKAIDRLTKTDEKADELDISS